ncbi:hypothetical protein B0H19DRAFT_1151661, partial [Mycena capillaripes]
MRFTIVFSTLLAAITAVSGLAMPDVVSRDVANGSGYARTNGEPEAERAVPVETVNAVVEVRAIRFVGFHVCFFPVLTYFFRSTSV